MPDPTRTSINALYQAIVYIFETTFLPYAHPFTIMQKANVLFRIYQCMGTCHMIYYEKIYLHAREYALKTQQ